MPPLLGKLGLQLRHKRLRYPLEVDALCLRPCRAELASGLAGTLYEYTSIPRELGGQAQEESAG